VRSGLASLAKLCLGGLLLLGCGSGFRSLRTETSSSSLGNTTRTIGTLTHFGDSITCGYFSSPKDGTGNLYSSGGYASLLSGQLGVTATNLCRPADQAADMVRTWVYPNTAPTMGKNQVYTAMIGSNDFYFCGLTNGCLENWQRSTGAAIAWLTLPDKDKILGSAIAGTSGTWNADSDFPMGLATNAANATATFTVNAPSTGKILYIAYRAFDSNPSDITTTTATVTIDGTATGRLSSLVDTGHEITTLWGLHDSIFLAKYSLSTAGSHTVKISTGATGGFFSVLWAGVAQEDYKGRSGSPSLILGTIPHAGSDFLNLAAALYNQRLLAMVKEFQQQGMNVTAVDTFDAFTNSDMTDTMHPNRSGHTKLAAVFKAVF